MKWLLTAAMTVFVSLSHAAPVLDRERLAREVGELLASRGVNNSTPGCAVGVIEHGEWALQSSYGMANLEHGIPITSQSIFRTGSLGKQFTATAIALLAEQGKIDLDADVHEYLPDLADYGHKVTVRQMIHHVSGIPDYEQGLPAMRTADGEDLELENKDYLSIREFYDRAKTIPLFAPPETEFAYSNTAYFLLSQVVEAVTGQTLRTFAQEHIFSPLEMHRSFFNDDVNGVVRNRVDGYHRNDDGSYSIFMTNLSWVGDGGVYTNLDDWMRWDQNFYHNTLGATGNELIERMEQPWSVSGNYAWGQEVGTYRGQKQVSHTGSWVGFTTFYARYPEKRTSVVVFCNSNVAIAYELMEIRDLVLDQITDTPRPEKSPGD